MGERISFPDPEQIVVDYLTEELAPVVVSTQVPSPRPKRFVRVMLTGTARRNMVTADAQVTVECWSTSESDAANLTQDTYGALSALDVGAAHVPQGEDGWLGGPYTSQDPTTGTPRYVMTVVLRMTAS